MKPACYCLETVNEVLAPTNPLAGMALAWMCASSVSCVPHCNLHEGSWVSLQNSESVAKSQGRAWRKIAGGASHQRRNTLQVFWHASC